MVRRPPSVQCFYIQLNLKSSQKFYHTAVLAKVDKYAEIEYSMVAPPAVSTSSINLMLKVKENFTIKCSENQKLGKKKLHGVFSLFRANFTTSGSIRNLLSLLQPFLCHRTTTTWCTSACLHSPSTLQHLFTTKLEHSACTSLMTWWVPSSDLPLVNQPADLGTDLSGSAPTDSQKLPHPTHHRNVRNIHPRGEESSHSFCQSPDL